MSLAPSQVHQFSDIGYEHPPFLRQVAAGLPMPGLVSLNEWLDGLDEKKCTFFNTWVCSNTSKSRQQMSNTSYITDFVDTDVESSVDRNRNSAYLVKVLSSYDRYFSARRFGWLGGDISASVPLSDDHVLWLFGDSIIGVSDAEGQRIGAHSYMIANSIGVTHLNPSNTDLDTKCQEDENITDSAVRSIKSVRYYWQEGREGIPAPILQLYNHLNICGSETSSVWPVGGGISIRVNNSDQVELLLVALIVCPTSSDKNNSASAGAFQFRQISNAVFRVENPFENPNAWKYTYRILQNGVEEGEKLKW